MTEELFDRVCQLVNLGAECMCGARLSVKNMEWYPHDNGIAVPNYEELQWVYVVCKKCEYQNSYRKILNRARFQK